MPITNVTVKVEHVVRLDDFASIAMRTTTNGEDAYLYCCVPDCDWELKINDDSFFYIAQMAVEHQIVDHDST
jgi:hypothetical protein